MSGRQYLKVDRILVVDPNGASAKMLANLLRSIWPSAQVYGAKDADTAMLLAQEVQPQLLFVESGPALDGIAFCRGYRRSDLDCREAPLVMIFSEVTAAQVLAARDAGVHEFLRRPFGMGDLEKRLEAVSGHARDWIEAPGYVGPDRRRFNSAEYKGPNKRSGDSSVKGRSLSQALKILQSAVADFDRDPVQAGRALYTQARVIIELSAGQELFKRLAIAATHLQAHLQNTAAQGLPIEKDQVATYAANVLLVAPEEVKPRAA